MEFKTDPITGAQVYVFGSIEDLKTLGYLWRKLFPKKSRFLNYDPSWIAEFYYGNNINWLKSNSNKQIFAPYEIVYDYRNNPIENWGTYNFIGDFLFPNKLARVKDEMIKMFSTNRQLYKGDSPCPRVNNVKVNKNSISFEIQKAFYYDQVATNLSLDFKHKDDIVDSIKDKTIREWDRTQSKTKSGGIPAFQKSNLANTIGVALGIVATNELGQKIILIRKRTSTVAVYQNMLHLPFSFALNFNTNVLVPNHIGTIKELISHDFRFEQAEELGLGLADIDLMDVKPLLFCRDLTRGGKPQFFLEIEIKTPYEELIKKITEQSKINKEFDTKILGMTLNKAKKSIHKFSPELLAYIVAKTSDK